MRLIASILSFILLSAPLFAAPADDSSQKTTEASGQPPKIGLTLSGGGAKGAAHIGVLKVLEEEGIPIDYVCGTSMGAIIGGLYSLGYTADDIEEIISTVDWGFLLSDNMNWKDLSSTQKNMMSSYLLTIPFGKRTGNNLLGAISKDDSKQSIMNTLPGGFIGGANILNTFNSLSVGYQDPMDFSELPIPFCCVAADVASCKQVVLKNGKLPEAMRASMAIPGAFAPVKIDNMMLVDGGLYNNFPVDVCKEMGADFVLGVNLRNEKDTTASNYSSLPKLVGRLLDIVTDYGIEEHAELCDLYFEPNMMGFTTFSFDPESIHAIVKRGYEAADVQRAAIRDLRKELDKYGVPYTQTYQSQKAINITPASDVKIAISDIETPGLSGKEKVWMLRKSGLNGVDSLNGQQINDAISKWKGTGFFESVNYFVSEGVTIDHEYVLTIRTVPEQKNTVSLGFRYDTEEAAAILLNFGFNQNSMRGFKVGAMGKLSYNPKVEVVGSYSSLPYPTVNLSASYRTSRSGMDYFGSTSYALAYKRFDSKLYLTQFHSKIFDVSSGLRFENFTYSEMMTKQDDNAGSKTVENTLSLFAHLQMDTKDNAYYATRGTRFLLDGEWIFQAMDCKGNVGSAMLTFETNIPFGEHFVLIPQVYARSLIGNSEFYLRSRYNLAGGRIPGRYIEQQIPLLGIRTPEIMYNNLGVVRVDGRYNIAGNHYVSALLNLAQDCKDLTKAFDKDGSNTWIGVGAEYSYNSFIGPLKLSFEWSDIVRHSEYVSYLDRLGIYISIGYDF